MNKTIRAEVIEDVVWQGVVNILLDPASLFRGYKKSLEEHEAGHSRQLTYLDTLHKKVSKLEQTRQNLNAAYIDPELPISRDEFIEQKTQLEQQLRNLYDDIEKVEHEILDIPTPIDLKSFEEFVAEISERLNYVDPTPQEKRHILELLNIKVWVDLDQNVRLEGWFTPQESVAYWTDNGNAGQP